VHSDICGNIRLTSTVQRHVLQHLWDMVETKTFMGEDGKVYHTDGSGTHLASENYGVYFGRFYVHPRTGILCEANGYRKYKYRGPKTPDWRRVIGDDTQAHRIDGVWYMLELVTVKPDPERTYYKDAAYGKEAKLGLLTIGGLNEKYGRGARCVRKRQLGKKDLKRLGLTSARPI
jgi:hypothetical protein